MKARKLKRRNVTVFGGASLKNKYVDLNCDDDLEDGFVFVKEGKIIEEDMIICYDSRGYNLLVSDWQEAHGLIGRKIKNYMWKDIDFYELWFVARKIKK